MNFENRWVLRSALNFASDGEVVREVGREFQRKGPEKADLAKECLTRVKKKREEDDVDKIRKSTHSSPSYQLGTMARMLTSSWPNMTYIICSVIAKKFDKYNI
ncbi:hypothetical protein HELRODRAFT_180283 [Helobdella robusta]|uniref:Uncharacterized protein n=1 Tax=Helobdella robusta TaxID=6412 RepID=T1FFP2_HELRO|nr:hypothetical protein HELRODRAFT_180283 [Helobdella robusta]ESN94114.1 hypothetical protein HELRODRAFT_180283 [Helobdella robusta]